MTRALWFVVLAACSGSENDPPRAELQVTLGPGAPTPLAAEVTSMTMSSRFIMQATDGRITVIVSLATPVTARQVNVESDTEVASVWGQLDATTPLLARAGTLTIDGTKKTFDFAFDNVSKPMDATGPQLLITGSMTDVSVP